jgi:hypothetical protein
MSNDQPDFAAALRKERRLLLQYTLGGGLFMGGALWQGNPWLALPVYGLLLVLLALRWRRTALILRQQQALVSAPPPA